MANVPIQFFQAGATVIPTLMIAVVVGMKYGEGPARRLEGKGKIARLVLVVLFVVSLLGGIFGAEFIALTALIQGGGTAQQAFYVWLGISVAFYFLAHEFMKPIRSSATGFEFELIDWLLLGMLLASLFVASSVLSPFV